MKIKDISPIRYSTFFLLLFVLSNISIAQDITGPWYAKTEAAEAEHLILDLKNGEDGLYGLLDIPGKNIFRLRLDSVGFTDNKEVFLLHKGMRFEYRGSFHQFSIKGQEKKDSLERPLVWFNQPLIERKQGVKQPVSYISREVQFINEKEKIELSGTLTLPAKKGKFPAVVLISGSGPQNRDEEILGHKPFLVLADNLSRNGIAVLRYDDRGTAKSKGLFRPATAENYAEDARAAVEYLKKHPNIHSNKIGLIGHSEGGNIAPMLAAQDADISFMVLMAAPGVSNLDMYLTQLDLIYKNETPEIQQRDIPFWEKVYRNMAQIQDKKVLKDSLNVLFDQWLRTIPAEELATVGDVEAYKAQEVDRHSSDWYHYFLRYNVNDYLPQLKIPLLAINGDKDIQVEAKQNLGGFRRMLENSRHPDYKIVELKNVNHFFQTCEKGDFQEIYFLTETFSPIALHEISSWIQKTVAKK